MSYNFIQCPQHKLRISLILAQLNLIISKLYSKILVPSTKIVIIESFLCHCVKAVLKYTQLVDQAALSAFLHVCPQQRQIPSRRKVNTKPHTLLLSYQSSADIIHKFPILYTCFQRYFNQHPNSSS